jgi:hypothetical protein
LQSPRTQGRAATQPPCPARSQCPAPLHPAATGALHDSPEDGGPPADPLRGFRQAPEPAGHARAPPACPRGTPAADRVERLQAEATPSGGRWAGSPRERSRLDVREPALIPMPPLQMAPSAAGEPLAATEFRSKQAHRFAPNRARYTISLPSGVRAEQDDSDVNAYRNAGKRNEDA